MAKSGRILPLLRVPAGAVFLPAAGYRDVTDVNYVGSIGSYWSASYDDSSYGARCVWFRDGSLDLGFWSRRHGGFSVRLVCSAQ